MSEGGGEVIAFDLLSEVAQGGKGLIKGIGAFDYQQVILLNAHLKVANTNLTINQQAGEFTNLSGETIGIPSFAHMEYELPNSYKVTLARQDHYMLSFSEYVRQFQPDVCLLQAEGSLESWKILNSIPSCQTFLYVQSGLELNSFKATGLEPPRCLANSEFVQKMLKERFGVQSELLYPAIQLNRYTTDHLVKKENETLNVLFVNPNQLKGLQIFLHLVQAFKNVNFKMLEGWTPIPENLKQYVAQFGNVECLGRTWKMDEIYSSVDLLLVPSQWEEAFGRVVVEAHMAGVPTLASQVGGLPEASGEAGLLVEDFKNPQAWEQAFSKIVDDPNCLKGKGSLLRENAERFTPEKAALRFAEIAKL